MIHWRFTGPFSTPKENHALGDFVSVGIYGEPGQFVDYCGMTIFDDEKLIAGCLYHNWHQESGVIEFSGYSRDKRWLTRPVINAMFNMPFAVLGCQLVAMRVSEREKPMTRICRSFGFSETYIPRLRGRDEGERIFTYTDDQWASSKYNMSRADNG